MWGQLFCQENGGTPLTLGNKKARRVNTPGPKMRRPATPGLSVPLTKPPAACQHRNAAQQARSQAGATSRPAFLSVREQNIRPKRKLLRSSFPKHCAISTRLLSPTIPICLIGLSVEYHNPTGLSSPFSDYFGGNLGFVKRANSHCDMSCICCTDTLYL